MRARMLAKPAMNCGWERRGRGLRPWGCAGLRGELGCAVPSVCSQYWWCHMQPTPPQAAHNEPLQLGGQGRRGGHPPACGSCCRRPFQTRPATAAGRRGMERAREGRLFAGGKGPRTSSAARRGRGPSHSAPPRRGRRTGRSHAHAHTQPSRPTPRRHARGHVLAAAGRRHLPACPWAAPPACPSACQ